MANDLTGKRVLITGGTRGVGRATVLMFARRGAHVVTCHHSPSPEAESLDKELTTLGGKHRIVLADVTDSSDVEHLAEECRTALGGLDVLVNNVGMDGSAPLEHLSPAQWHRMLDVNLTSTYLVTRAALVLLADGGAIVNIGSAAALRGRPASAHYSASKAALRGLTRGLCKELGGRGIRVNAVEPGVVDAGPGHDGPPPRVVERLVAMTPLGRLCTPDDVAGAVGFLAGDDARFVSGTVLTVDGGM